MTASAWRRMLTSSVDDGAILLSGEQVRALTKVLSAAAALAATYETRKLAAAMVELDDAASRS